MDEQLRDDDQLLNDYVAAGLLTEAERAALLDAEHRRQKVVEVMGKMPEDWPSMKSAFIALDDTDQVTTPPPEEQLPG